ncbi:MULTISPECIES: hypothetical protein [unclassified Aeromicrobium]|uniref:hypothetical protein n=1 Tax=unclassified Aeromicrobium TaxID=2633570 RepID=UPI00288AFEE8|nr:MULTISPECIES: hypothetical protein [unclassified Aeromicrobium]
MTTAPPADVTILDTVCVLNFAAAKELKILLNALKAANCELFVPQEVYNEAVNKARANGWDVSQMTAIVKTEGPIKLLQLIGPLSSAIRTLDMLRRRYPLGSGLAGGGHPDQHLGEYAVMTHGIGARDQGREVRLGIDDRDARETAEALNFECFTIEDALLMAVAHGLLDTNGVKKTYERLRPFGALPHWDVSDVKSGLAAAKKEARARKETAEAAGSNDK